MAIADLLPQAGAMVLIDDVEGWDAVSVACTTLSHRRADNPLRIGAVLPAAAAVELGAQAMAIHGALLGGGAPRAGLLAAVSDLELAVARLDDVADVLRVEAMVERAAGRGRIYWFVVSVAHRELVSGRLTVMLAG